MNSCIEIRCLTCEINHNIEFGGASQKWDFHVFLNLISKLH
jgi:hypothetical protein